MHLPPGLTLPGDRPEGMIMFLGLLAVVRVRRSPLPRLGPAAVAYPGPFPLQVCVDGPGDVAGVSAWGCSRYDPGVKPQAPCPGTTTFLTSPVAASA